MQSKYKSIFEATRGVIFLGTPHRGSDLAVWGHMMSSLAKLAMQDSNQQILDSLAPNNELLNRFNQNFLQLFSQRTFGVHSFYEAKAMTGIYGIKGLVGLNQSLSVAIRTNIFRLYRKTLP